MSTTTETPHELYVSCRTPSCPGFAQRVVEGVARHISFSYLDLGGDLGGQEERSTIQYVPVDEDLVGGSCERCGSALLVAEKPRAEYPKLSQEDINQRIESSNPNIQATIDQAIKIDQLERKLAELTEASASATKKTKPVDAIPDGDS